MTLIAPHVFTAASAYKDDKWITDLVSYTASLPTSAPLIGICFGHQIIARAHGAVVEKNEKGWEIGTRDIDLNELGQAIWRGASGAGTTLVRSYLMASRTTERRRLKAECEHSAACPADASRCAHQTAHRHSR